MFKPLVLTLVLFSGSYVSADVLKGTVLDSMANVPLPGVTVTVKGTATQGLTDAQGKFSLNYSSAVQDQSLPAVNGQPRIVFDPAQGMVTWDAVPSGRLSVCTMTGLVVATTTQKTLDVRALSDGMYLIEVSGNQGSYCGKLVLAGNHGNVNLTTGLTAKAAATVTLTFAKTDFYLTKERAATLGDTAIQVVLNGWPNSVNTGTHGTLTTDTGSTSFYTNGTTTQNMAIEANGLYIAGSNITFRNCKFTYTGAMDASFTMVNVCGGCGATGILFEDCEFDGADKCSRAVSGGGVGTNANGLVVRRCNIHHTGNAVEVGQKFTVEDSYLHDIFTPAGQGWHADGIQAANGTISDILVRHSTIFLTGSETGCINICTTNITNCIITNNLMGGGGYSMYTFGDNNNNYQVTNNRFTTRIYPKVGYWNLWYPSALTPATAPVVSGNTIWETGAAANSNL